ncbi:hypothetical protein AVEN_238170-1 [Araneus ventricosus]|uniref:Uncharacterized protein n=1 Tax=Araneus ventricosus TaxID=182803 RepID=A0A4Y2GAX4_ARAVE|nr:hypothetical protein AVEN_238170-1 [Araneus ventricosus]
MRIDGLIINCVQQDDIDLILNEINDSSILKENVRPVPVPKRSPKLIVYGLDLDISKESVESATSHISCPKSLNFYFRLKEEQISFIRSLKQILHFIIPSRSRIGFSFIVKRTEFNISSVYTPVPLSNFGPFSIEVFVFLPICGYYSDNHDSKSYQADFLR